MLVPILLLFVAASYGDSEDGKFTCPGAGNFPNPEDCGSFYICATGSEPVIQDCPGDLLFDPALKICNNPGAVNCQITSEGTSSSSTSSTPTPTSSSTSSSSTSTTSSPTSTSSSTTSSPTSAPSSSSSNPTESTTPITPTTDNPGFEPNCPDTGIDYLENPNDCTSFFVCIDGDYALVDCPEGYGFSPATEDCEPAEEIGCGATATTPSTPVQCPPSGTSTLPNPSDCGSFYLCINGTSSVITCSIGDEFNKVSQKCESPSTAGCSVPTKPTSPTESTSPGPTTSTTSLPGGVPDCSGRPNGEVFPNLKDCSTFFQCSNGLILTNNCPPGLEFNAALKVCDRPENAHCQEVNAR